MDFSPAPTDLAPARKGVTATGLLAFAWAVVAVVFIILWARARKACPKEKYAGRYGCSVGADAHPAARAEDAALRHLGAVRD